MGKGGADIGPGREREANRGAACLNTAPLRPQGEKGSGGSPLDETTHRSSGGAASRVFINRWWKMTLSIRPLSPQAAKNRPFRICGAKYIFRSTAGGRHVIP